MSADDIDPGGPWLSAHQQLVWRRWLAVWRETQSRIERDMQQRGGMPFSDYLVLAMLSEAPQRQMRMNRLSESVRFSQSRLSHALTRLEGAGWVRREQADEDRRGQIATLTEAGFHQLQDLSPLHAETVRSYVFDSLSSEQLGELGRIFDTILAPTAPPEI